MAAREENPVNDDRYKAIKAELGQPDSRSPLQSLQQVANKAAHQATEVISMEAVERLKHAWNTQADALNQWDELGLDEIVHFAQQRQVEQLKDLLFWVLWHHQGEDSPVGRPVRKVLGLGPREALSVGDVHAATAEVTRLMGAAEARCRYPDCGCPLDDPGTPGWCAKRGPASSLPKW